MRLFCLLLGLSGIVTAYAQEAKPIQWPELNLQAEYAVEGMAYGNLSGLAQCHGVLWAVSDRVDDQLYQLTPVAKQGRIALLTAKPIAMQVPAPPTGFLPWWLNLANQAVGKVRHGYLDFEGISCDQASNKYVVSEAYLAVLKVSAQGVANWLTLPDELWQQTAQQGLLQQVNQLFEGVAVDAQGKRLWLAAERNKRGILALTLGKQGWQCPNQQCVVLAEAGIEVYPKQFRRKKRKDVKDFSDITVYKDKLFTLERTAYRICRRNLSNAHIERCWSIAKEALVAHRQYKAYGMPEALSITDEGAWVGIDNDINNQRIDGESRPIVWFFAVPKGGWITDGTTK